MGLVMTISDRIAVLDFGRKIAEGLPAEVRQTRRSSRPTWASDDAGSGPVTTVLLEIEDIHVFYGQIEALKGITLDGRPGRDRGPDRRQRGGQDHHPEDDLRACGRSARGMSASTGEDITRMAGHKRVGLGLSQAPEGGASSPA